jgi:cytochrome c-type biogenesis protein
MTQSIPQISLIAAFSAGLLSFVSPCVLPLVPSYISYITGLSVEQLTDASERVKFKKAIILNSLLFIAGFSSVFIAFGASASFLGQVLITYQDHIRRFGGALIVLFGLYLLGILNLNFLKMEHRFQFRSRPAGYLGSYLIGVAFAAGWTPCVGPVLGGILALAFESKSVWHGAALLGIYSLGLGLPFLAIGLAFDSLRPVLLRLKRFSAYVYIAGGLLLIATGLLMWMNKLNWYS